MTGTAQEIADAYRVGRIAGLLESPGSDRWRTNECVCDMLLGRFHKQARREHLTHERIEEILAAAEQAIAEARAKILEGN